jgi:hypothetical protein
MPKVFEKPTSPAVQGVLTDCPGDSVPGSPLK